MEANSEAPKPRKLFSRREALILGASALAGVLGCTPRGATPSPERPASPKPESPTAPAAPAKPTEAPKPSVPEAARKPEFTPKIVGGLETWGQDKPFTREEQKRLEQQLNALPTEIRADTYYGTFYIEKSVYDRFNREVKEGYQSYLMRHEQVFNEILSRANTGTNIKFRRLVIMDNDKTLKEGEFRDHLKDSDGGWDFFDSPNPYLPKVSAFYDEKTKIDNALLHEIGHSTLFLPDHYSLDFSNRNANPVADLPEHWKSYKALTRPDIGNDLMSGPVLPFINRHSQLQLWRRLPGNIHDKNHHKEADWAYPNEIPQVTYLNFGKDLAGSKVALLRSFDPNPKSDIRLTERKDLGVGGEFPIGADGRVRFDRDQLFPPGNNNMLRSEDSTLLLRFGGGQGRKYFRWMDVRDFNIAHWLGYTDAVSMKIKGATAADKQETFDWKIEYSKP